MTEIAIAWVDAAKRRMAVLGVAVVVLAALASVLIGTTLLMAASTGADVRTAFNDPMVPPPEHDGLIVWGEGPELLRSLEPATGRSVELTWLRALHSIDNAAVNGELSGIEVWYSGPAKVDVLDALALEGLRRSPEWSEHQLTPTFYSIDGQVLRLDIESRGRLSLDGDHVEIADHATAILLLRDGNWRVEHFVRTDGS